MTDGATRLQAFIKRHKLTQLAAADALGVSDPTIHDWVTGAKRPTSDHRDAIELWTGGAVPRNAWQTKEERAARSAVRPFAPTKKAG